MANITLAQSLSHVIPSQIRAIADVAFAMDDILKLHFGESNIQTPRYLNDAAYQAMNDGFTFYTENAGLPSLRQAIADKYRQLHHVEVNPADEIVITASGVQALNVSIRCVIDPGDEAIVLTPNWPNASAIVSLFSGIPREIPLVWNGQRYTIDFDGLERPLTARTRLLVYTSPSNPLGWVADTTQQEALLDFCHCNKLWLLADEVYERIYYAGTVAPSILRLCSREDAVVVVQSFSKSYCMTGWRLGWIVSRRDLVKKATQLNEFIVSHAPSMIQKAGETALEQGEGEILAMVTSLQQKARLCYEALKTMDRVTVAAPEGAFYLYPQIQGVEDSFSFALKLLKETRVAVAPGVAFGNGGEGAVRICFAADGSILEKAMERIDDFLAK